MATHPARQLWWTLEALHAVTYFAPGVKRTGEAVGLKGFWMTYFAFRAAPMGPVPPDVVVATFAGFHPAMVRRALPDAWLFSTPSACLNARVEVSAGALREAGVVPAAAVTAVDHLAPIVRRLDLTGRPLAAANVGLPLPDDPVEALWQLATTFREHRGDGHVAALVALGISGLEAHVLQTLAKNLQVDVMLAARGWSRADWDAAGHRLRDRGLLTAGAQPTLTEAGRSLIDRIEDCTDERAWTGGLSTLGADGVATIVDAMRRSVKAIVDSGMLPFPNPMGAPDPTR